MLHNLPQSLPDLTRAANSQVEDQSPGKAAPLWCSNLVAQHSSSLSNRLASLASLLQR
jgi:hypothetical protein